MTKRPEPTEAMIQAGIECLRRRNTNTTNPRACARAIWQDMEAASTSPVQPAPATPTIDQLTTTIRGHVYRNAGPMQLFEWSAPDIKEPHAGWRLAPQAAQALATTIHKDLAGTTPPITESEFICLSNLLTFLRKGWDGDTVLVKGNIKGHQNAFPIHHSSYAEALRKAIAAAVRTPPVQPEPDPPPVPSFASPLTPDIRLAIRIAVISGVMTNGAREFLRDILDQPATTTPTNRGFGGTVRLGNLTAVLEDLIKTNGPKPNLIAHGLIDRYDVFRRAEPPATTCASQAQEPIQEGKALDPSIVAQIINLTQAWLTASLAAQDSITKAVREALILAMHEVLSAIPPAGVGPVPPCDTTVPHSGTPDRA